MADHACRGWLLGGVAFNFAGQSHPAPLLFPPFPFFGIRLVLIVTLFIFWCFQKFTFLPLVPNFLLFDTTLSDCLFAGYRLEFVIAGTSFAGRRCTLTVPQVNIHFSLPELLSLIAFYVWRSWIWLSVHIPFCKCIRCTRVSVFDPDFFNSCNLLWHEVLCVYVSSQTWVG